MIVTLILLMCLRADDARCMEYRPPQPPDLSLSTCIRLGPQAGAEFVGVHPDWRMAKWGCQIGPRQERT